MPANAFVEKTRKPTDAELAEALGRPAKALWDSLTSELAKEHGVTVPDWHSYSRKAGWALRLKKKERAIVYLSPWRGGFMASFALGEKAAKAARESGVPAAVVQLIDEARKYAEGRAVRIDVRGPEDVAAVVKVAVAKMEN
jgi:RNAse (barnase) inhibitor barstar